MPAPSDPPESRAAGHSPAARYWDQVLDPQNLERGSSGEGAGPGTGTVGHQGAGISLQDEIEFARTPDLSAARGWLTSGAVKPAWIMDLGAGLGANSFALALAGHEVVAVDTSPARLRALKARAAEAGCAERVRVVVAAAEALPFAPGSVPAIYTKSVLIHTELEQAAREIARTLAPGGRAALVEPEPGNPFVEAYRRWLAPKAWRAITRYFDPEAQGVFIRAEGMKSAARPVEPFYFLAFFAFAFQFAWPHRKLYRLTLGTLHGVDRILFRLIPPLRRWAWFGLIRIEKKISK